MPTVVRRVARQDRDDEAARTCQGGRHGTLRDEPAASPRLPLSAATSAGVRPYGVRRVTGRPLGAAYGVRKAAAAPAGGQVSCTGMRWSGWPSLARIQCESAAAR